MSKQRDCQTIIQSPEARRMLEMVTKGFYDRSYNALWMFESIGREYDDMKKWIQELRVEAFPQTCTWSIGIWEWVYGIEPDDQLSLEYRRSRVVLKKLQHPPINPTRIDQILSELTGCPVDIVEDIAPYTFQAIIHETLTTKYSYQEVVRLLTKIKPSHVSFELKNITEEEYLVNDCYVACMSDYITIYETDDVYESV